MDKAPDAFRTISEVAEDLDIPQHVLRFWETRFSQIRPMKRSGGRRYYRPDDVDLLRGIRRLLYGEGYTIRGVQRILKEHGIASVQRLADASADNTVALPLPVFQGVFMNDADPATAKVVHAQLRPQPYRYFTDAPVNGTAYQDAGVPLSYVLSADDVALPPGEYGWDRFAKRIGTTPINTPGSHESLFTKPAELADALLVAAEVS